MDCVSKPLGGAIQFETGGNNVLIVRVIASIKLQLQYAFILAPQERQNAVRGQCVERLVEGEVILKLRPFCFLALNDVRAHNTLSKHALSHLTHQVSVQC